MTKEDRDIQRKLKVLGKSLFSKAASSGSCP